jgi:Fe-S-cluster-containing hydrogenase component 2
MKSAAVVARDAEEAESGLPELHIYKDWRELRAAPLFSGLPDAFLRDAITAERARILRLERDVLVPVDGAVLVRSGQLGLAEFPAEVLQATAKPKKKAKLPPLSTRATRNLVSLEEGDIYEVAAHGLEASRALFTVTPAVVLIIDRPTVDQWKREITGVSDRFRRAAYVLRARLNAVGGAKALTADFYIRNGLSVSQTLRVRRLDACIECGACEQACEERYGKKRLSLNGRILGALDFVDTCHTCTDARCIDPCKFDAIHYIAERREVLINEANCTGCTLCASACPYGAIEMHDLDEAPLLKKRLQIAGALLHGPGTPRKARLRSMASKCDHCTFYEDQACITACPTGALLEMRPSEVIAQIPEVARKTIRDGFLHSVAINTSEFRALNATAGYHTPIEVALPTQRTRPTRRLPLRSLWIGGAALMCLALCEIVLRRLSPVFSLGYLYQRLVERLEPAIAAGRVHYTPGCGLAVGFGYVGVALLLSTMSYLPRRLLPFLRGLGSTQMWLEWHVLAGVYGSAFVVLHSAAKLDNWVSTGVWAMLATVLSGIFGRYLHQEVPQRVALATMEALEIREEINQLSSRNPGAEVVLDFCTEYHARVAAHLARVDALKSPHRRALSVLAWILGDDLRRGFHHRRLAAMLRRRLPGWRARRVRRSAIELGLRLAVLERRAALLSHIEPLFRRWKIIHIGAASALTVIATIHIWLARHPH